MYKFNIPNESSFMTVWETHMTEDNLFRKELVLQRNIRNRMNSELPMEVATKHTNHVATSREIKLKVGIRVHDKAVKAIFEKFSIKITNGSHFVIN